MYEAHDALICIGEKILLMIKIDLDIAISIILNHKKR